MYDEDYDDVPFNNEKLPMPDFFDFSNQVTSSMLYSSANFFRTASNTNIHINIPLGSDISPGTIWFSPNIYLPDDIFNSIKPIDEVLYPNYKDVRILTDLVFLHDILVQYKITKSDQTNFANQRELRCTLVREDGVSVYDSALYSNQQPDSGQHDYILLRGHITHNLGDLVRLKLNIAQNNIHGDQTDTEIVIFRISWNILAMQTG